jgi:hypothetical protein
VRPAATSTSDFIQYLFECIVESVRGTRTGQPAGRWRYGQISLFIFNTRIFYEKALKILILRFS